EVEPSDRGRRGLGHGVPFAPGAFFPRQYIRSTRPYAAHGDVDVHQAWVTLAALESVFRRTETAMLWRTAARRGGSHVPPQPQQHFRDLSPHSVAPRRSTRHGRGVRAGDLPPNGFRGHSSRTRTGRSPAAPDEPATALVQAGERDVSNHLHAGDGPRAALQRAVLRRVPRGPRGGRCGGRGGDARDRVPRWRVRGPGTHRWTGDSGQRDTRAARGARDRQGAGTAGGDGLRAANHAERVGVRA